MLAFFALLKFENKRDATIIDFNFNLKHHGQDLYKNVHIANFKYCG